MLALLGRAFSCLIPDKPLTRYEQLVVGIGTGGAFRGNFRIAAVDFVDDQLAVKAATDKVAGGVTVTVATTATRDITEIRATPIPFGFQMEAVLTRSLVVGGGFALTLLIFAIKGGGGGNSGVAVLVSILFVFAMGFLFSFLPGYFLAKKDLSEVQFICKDGHALSVALSPLQMEFAKAILEAQGLHIIESNEAIVMAIT